MLRPAPLVLPRSSMHRRPAIGLAALLIALLAAAGAYYGTAAVFLRASTPVPTPDTPVLRVGPAAPHAPEAVLGFQPPQVQPWYSAAQRLHSPARGPGSVPAPAVHPDPKARGLNISSWVWGMAALAVSLGALLGRYWGLHPPRAQWVCAGIMQQNGVLPEPKEYKRRKKKNKYAHLSKADKKELDPLEELERKAQHFNEAQEATKKAPPKERKERPRPTAKIEPSDHKAGAQAILPEDPEEVDPYDPTSFGFVEVGTIFRPHGIRGEVKVMANTDFGEDRLCKPGVINLKAAHRRFPRPRILERGRRQDKNVFILKFRGTETEEAAELLRGYKVYHSLRMPDQPSLEEEEWMVQDLVGLVVQLEEDAREIGFVRSVVLGDDLCAIKGLMQDLLEVQLHDFTLGMNEYRTVLVPFDKSIVPEVNLGRGMISIQPPEGLLELSQVKEEKVVIRGLLPA